MAEHQYEDFVIASSFQRLNVGQVRYDYHTSAPHINFGLGGSTLGGLVGDGSDAALAGEARALGEMAADLMRREDLQERGLPGDMKETFETAVENVGLDPEDLSVRYINDDVALGGGVYQPRRLFIVIRKSTNVQRVYRGPSDDVWIEEFAREAHAGKFD